MGRAGYGLFEEKEFALVFGNLPVNLNSVHPAPMRDIGKAFLTIRAHADEWLVDMDRIAICGFSAGAHNCAMYSVYWDELVPVKNTTRMANALAQAGVPFEVHIFEDGMHGLSLADQASAGSLMQMDTDAAKWIGLAEAWLKKRFSLALPEKSDWMAAMEANNMK